MQENFVNHSCAVSAEEYNILRAEYGNHFEKLSTADRCIMLAVLSIQLHNLLMNDPPFVSKTTYSLYEHSMSPKARGCCLRLIRLTFDHMTCACTALLSHLNLPSE